MTSSRIDAQPAKKFINMLRNIDDQWPSFTLLLGAGASVESGIKSGAQLFNEWRSQHHQAFGDGKIAEQKHLEKQLWYGADNEYSELFESLYDTPSQRRDFIESVIGKCKPSWGYMYLVDLIRRDVFNTIFTTNFDDLLNEACYGFSSDVRPVVSSHDASIQSVRLSSKRPKIIKLHGDFLYDSIKNTARELESLETNMKEKLREFSNEYGLIVVGYAGADRSIMEALDSLLRNHRAFPHGVYWCVRSTSEISPMVEEMARFPNFHFIKIDGFDAFMAELHKGLGLETHPIIESPYDVTKARIESMLSGLNVSGQISPQLNEDISTMIDRLSSNEMPSIEIPYHIVARGHFNAGQLNPGINTLVKGMRAKPGDRSFSQYLELYIDASEAARDFSRDAEIAGIISDIPTRGLRARIGYLDQTDFNRLGLRCIKSRRFALALELVSKDQRMLITCPEYHAINIAQVSVHQGKQLTEEAITKMEKIAQESKDPLAVFGAHCVLQDKQKAVSLFVKNTDVRTGKVFDQPWSFFLDLPICDLLGEMKTRLLEILNNSPDDMKALIDKISDGAPPPIVSDLDGCGSEKEDSPFEANGSAQTNDSDSSANSAS